MHESPRVGGPSSQTEGASSSPVTSHVYRPALDGIRAIAVLSVLFYHLQMPWMRGGFLGVDVFFVLSGYLITGLLLAEHAATGRISLTQFWTRRARRLLPALLLLIVAVAAGVQSLRPIPEWPARLADLFWTLLYGANWHQIATSQDYFAKYTGVSPLRHMWSIAIEEQFYLAWPLIVAIVCRLRGRRWLLPGIVVATAASAIAMFVHFTPVNPTRAYVGTDTRAQELFVGAALAVIMQARLARGVAARLTRTDFIVAGLCASVVTLAMIGLPDNTREYYEGGALMLAVAVAVVIFCVESAPRSAIARVLSWGPLTWVGRISYGLYLWHWPAIVFMPTALVMVFAGRGMAVADNRLSLDLVTVGAALLFTVVSYYVVEQPIRRGVLSRFLTPAPVAVASVTAAYGVFLAMNSFLAVPPELKKQMMQENVVCETHACQVLDAGPGRPVLALMGDSVIRSLVPAFRTVAQTHSWSLVSAAHDGGTVVERRLVRDDWQNIRDRIPPRHAAVLGYKPAVIIVGDFWLPVDSRDDAGNHLVRGSATHVADIERRLGLFVEKMTASGGLVVFMTFLHESQALECENPNFKQAEWCAPRQSDPLYAPYNEMLARVARRYPDRVRVLDLSDLLCPDDVCPVRIDGIVMRYDTLHFSAEAARWLVPHLERKLLEAGVRLNL